MIKFEKRETIQWTDETKTDTCFKDDYVLELWNASTKHPDSEFHYSDWDNKSPFIRDELQIYQWLLYCASRLSFPFFAKEVVDYATKEWYNWE